MSSGGKNRLRGGVVLRRKVLLGSSLAFRVPRWCLGILVWMVEERVDEEGLAPGSAVEEEDAVPRVAGRQDVGRLG